MKDGTVIGTNAWIDGFGYLRQSDYIADHEGYRILKSKTVFVGKDSSIEVRIMMTLISFDLFISSPGGDEENKENSS